MPGYYFKITPRQFPTILYNSLILPSTLYEYNLVTEKRRLINYKYTDRHNPEA
jgi:hypothetical protein